MIRKNWSLTEEIELLERYKCFGRRWKLIEEYLPGRCESNIKNKFYSILKKEIIAEGFQDKVKELEDYSVTMKEMGINWVENVIQRKRAAVEKEDLWNEEIKNIYEERKIKENSIIEDEENLSKIEFDQPLL